MPAFRAAPFPFDAAPFLFDASPTVRTPSPLTPRPRRRAALSAAEADSEPYQKTENEKKNKKKKKNNDEFFFFRSFHAHKHLLIIARQYIIAA